MRFESPLALLLLLLLPLAFEAPWRSLLLSYLRIKSKHPADAALLFSSPVELGRLPLSWRSRLLCPVLSLLRAAALTCLILALARPQAGAAFLETDAAARDLMLTLDTSGSMRALDFSLSGSQTSRLEALKSVVKDFIDQRTGDRIGLIVFGTEVYTQCPLTLDHSILNTYIDNLEIGMAGDSTSLGEAIALSVKRIKDIKANSKAIILVTDGKQTSGSVGPLEAAQIAQEYKIKIYAIGIGGHQPAPFKVKNFFGQEDLIYEDVPLDENTLMEVAKKTRGIYFNANNTEELKRIYQEIDRLEERHEKAENFVEYQEFYHIPAALALLLTVVLQIMQWTVFRKIP